MSKVGKFIQDCTRNCSNVIINNTQFGGVEELQPWLTPDQAGKDLELSWEDMRELYIIFAEVDAEIELCKTTDITAETTGYFQEVLKRFKDFKERKKECQ